MNIRKLMKKVVCLMLALLLMLGASSCALLENEIVEIPEEEAEPYLSMTQEFMDKLLVNDYTACHALFGENLASGKSRSQLQEEWEQMRLAYGNPVGVQAYECYRINGEGSIVAQVAMAHGICTVQFIYDKKDEMVSLWFGTSEEETAYTIEAPEGVKEYELTLGAGTEYPLRAILTLPENTVMDVPCVVLVHDAGAYDLNSALGGCVPFADIAHGLAQQGVAALRYDKRTYAHGASFDEETAMNMTVQQEVIDDALLAVAAAADAQTIDPDAIYVAGHGLGGLLAPRIAAQSGGKVSGVISLAGTTRGYLDVAYDQNIAMTNDAERKNAIKKEYKKVGKLEEMKDTDTVFGIPVPYLKDLYENPVSAQLAEMNIPVLVLHGKNDFQYTLNDFKSWQTALEGYAGESELVLFDDLNHLFVDNTSLKRRGTTAEYLADAHVAQEVVDTMARWVKDR